MAAKVFNIIIRVLNNNNKIYRATYTGTFEQISFCGLPQNGSKLQGNTICIFSNIYINDNLIKLVERIFILFLYKNGIKKNKEDNKYCNILKNLFDK